MARYPDAALLGAALVALAPATGQATERQEIDIAAGRLGDAIIALGRQSGTSIGISDQSLAGIAVPAIRGRMSAGRALDRMLKGTQARAVAVGDTGWRIVRAHVAKRPAAAPVATAPVILPDPEPAEIIVTASKRDTPLPRYAGMVDLVDGTVMTSAEAAGGTGSLISRVAALSSTHAGPGRNKLFIRAIADSAFAGPTQATTGQYLGDMRLNYAAPDPDLKLYDIGGIEVLEGPQGTLYGAGSLGGIIRMVPNAPNLGRYSAQVSTGLSLTQHGEPGADASAVVNIPIVQEKLALRVVAYGARDGGYIDDVGQGKKDVNRTATYGGRAALRYAPDDDWTIDLNLLYQRIEGDDAQYASERFGDLTRSSSVAQPYFTDYKLANLRVERQWDDLRFVSSVGYVRHLLAESYDATQPQMPAAVFRQRNQIEIFSTENRLVRDLDDGLGWILGASYMESRSTIHRSLTSYGFGPELAPVIPGVPVYGRGLPAQATGVRNKVSEATLFGEASVEPWRGLVVTAGGRLTYSRLTGEAIDEVAALSSSAVALAEAQADRHETVFLPSLSILSDAIPGITLYAKYQQGYRPGGLAVDDQRVQRFRNDRIQTIEVGVRQGVPGRDTIAVSANAAYTDWDDIQADVTDRIGLPTTANIGDGRIYTLEGRAVWRPAPKLTVDGSIIYNDSRLTRPEQFLRVLSFEGQSLTLPNVANLGGRIALDWRTDLSDTLSFHANGSARYVGKSRLGVGPIVGREQGDYVDTAMNFSLTRGRAQLSLSLTNLLDSNGNRFALGTPFDLRADYYTPLRPRTVRIGLDYAF